jgi:hypothetical protein
MVAREAYSRDLCLQQRIKYVHTFILSKIWHVTQIFPATQEQTRQMLTAVSWYIWHGAVFRAPLSTLQCEANAGGLGLMDVDTKCLGLFLMRCRSQANMSGSLTARWIEFWTSRHILRESHDTWSICAHICHHGPTLRPKGRRSLVKSSRIGCISPCITWPGLRRRRRGCE